MNAEQWAWVDAAACRGSDPDIFFPDYPHHPRQKWSRKVRAEFQVIDDTAKAVCAGCPVIEQCRDWAFWYPEKLGTWGGMTAYDRRVAQGRTVARFSSGRECQATA